MASIYDKLNAWGTGIFLDEKGFLYKQNIFSGWWYTM